MARAAGLLTQPGHALGGRVESWVYEESLAEVQETTLKGLRFRGFRGFRV